MIQRDGIYMAAAHAAGYGADGAAKDARNPRQRLLQEAMEITSKDRNQAYGNPEDNFRHIAEFWSTYLTTSKGKSIVVTPFDVSMMMVLMKTARLATNPTHRDSLVDQAGYSACAADCQEAMLRNKLNKLPVAGQLASGNTVGNVGYDLRARD